MQRAVICVSDPWNYIDQYSNYSLMIVNPTLPQSRLDYLLDKADWSLLITADNIQQRNGKNYQNEKVVWYTSGTTGDSKFFSVSQHKLDHVCNRLIADYDITANDRYVSIMPLWHAHGQTFYWLAKKVGFEIDFLPVSKISQIEKYNPTFITGIPDLLKVLAQFRLPSLRFARTASAALSDKVYEMLKNKLNVPIIEAFGMTESTSHCFTNPLHGEQRVGTVGLPTGIEAEIRDQKVWIRGPAVQSADWFDTGDLGEIDHRGYFRILGRAQDTINIKGYKFNPVSLEQQLVKQFPDITECVVFGTDKVKCLYSGQIEVTAVSKFLQSLNVYCKPKLIQQVEKIPVNSMGKISRSILNQEFQ